MALIKCPDCGNPVSDKAAVCPHCGVDIQKVLAEIREKQQQKRKKRQKRIIISVASVFLVMVIAALAYLYSIDGLNTIPPDYRKETEKYLGWCESAIGKGDFNEGTRVLDYFVTGRNMTNRQAKRLEENKKTLTELRLKDLENRLETIQTNGDAPIGNKFFEQADKDIAVLNTAQLNASQTERLERVKDLFLETQLAEIQRLAGLYETSPNKTDYYTQINCIAGDLQNEKLSTEQKSSVVDAINNAERIKKQEEDRRHRQLLATIQDEYIKLVDNISKEYDLGFWGGNVEYFLFDIDKNEIPEIWIKAGTCEADYKLLVYTYNKRIDLLYDGGPGSADHASFYQGDGYILQDSGNMGYYRQIKYTLNSNRITETTVISGSESYNSNPKERPIVLHSYTDKKPIINAFRYVSK